jgi:hypothetical protein
MNQILKYILSFYKDEEKEDLKLTIANLENQLRKIKESNESLDKELKLNELAKNCKELENLNLKKEIHNLKIELNKNRYTFIEEKNLNEKLLKEQQEKLVETMLYNEKLESDVEILKKQIEVKDLVIQEKISENDHLTNEIEKLRIKLLQIQNQLEISENNYNVSIKSIEKLFEDIQELKKDLESKKKYQEYTEFLIKENQNIKDELIKMIERNKEIDIVKVESDDNKLKLLEMEKKYEELQIDYHQLETNYIEIINKKKKKKDKFLTNNIKK